MDFDHLLVTKGLDKDSYSLIGIKVTPLVLVHVSEKANLAYFTREEIFRRATLFLPSNATEVQRIQFLSSKYVAETANNLW